MRCEICQKKKARSLPDKHSYCLKCVRCNYCGSGKKKTWWWPKDDWFYCKSKCYFKAKTIPLYIPNYSSIVV